MSNIGMIQTTKQLRRIEFDRSNDMRKGTFGHTFSPLKFHPSDETSESHYCLSENPLRNFHIRYHWIRVKIMLIRSYHAKNT